MDKKKYEEMICNKIKKEKKKNGWEKITAEKIFAEIRLREQNKFEFLSKFFAGVRVKGDKDYFDLVKLDKVVQDFINEGPPEVSEAFARRQVYYDIISSI